MNIQDQMVMLIDRLEKTENENKELKARLDARLTWSFIEVAQKHAVQDFVAKLKEKCDGVWKYECSFENIMPFIQELLKEY